MPTEKDVDLAQIISKQRNRITIEPAEAPAERKHRLALESAGAREERIRDRMILVFVLIGVGVIFALCVWLVVADPRASSEDRKWATAVFASFVASGMGYLVGKGRASK